MTHFETHHYQYGVCSRWCNVKFSKMKTIIIIKYCVAVLLTIVQNGVRTESIIETLKKMARSGGIIDGIFKPALNGSLGHTQFGCLYRGQLIPLGKEEIAMKFTPIKDKEKSRNEYEMYTYLNAINESSDDCLRFGIPKIYYYGTWDNSYTMLAMTLLKFTSHHIFGMTEEDVLVACREFVKTIKYIHSQGITHGAMKIEWTMVIQDGRGYIFNFGKSKDMAKHRSDENLWNAKHDFGYFLYSLFKLKSAWQWFGFSNEASQKMDYFTFLNKSTEVSKNRNEENDFTGLKRIFVEFRKHAVDNQFTWTRVKAANGTWIPFYDHLYQVIDEEMKNCGEEDSSSNLSITDIPDPCVTTEWSRPQVDYEQFENEYSKFREKAQGKAHEKAAKGSCSCFGGSRNKIKQS